MLQDLRFGLRMLAKSPLFAAVSVLTLALGIAAAVAEISLLDALFLRRLPVPNAERLVRVSQTPNGAWTVNYPEYAYFREHSRTFETIVAHYSTAPLYTSFNGISEETQGAVVSANYFPTLGIRPLLGRFFTDSEDEVPMRDPVVVISYDFWQERYRGEPSVIGRTLTINSTTFQIVGVAPQGFNGIEMGVSPNQLWIPTMTLPVGYRFCNALSPSPSNPCAQLQMVGLLRPGQSLTQAAAEINTLADQLRITVDPERGRSVVEELKGVRPIGRRFTVAITQRLGAAAVLLLLVSCANVAGLLLARAAGRTREITTRIAVGASRARIVRQLLTESLALAMVGGFLGVILQQWAGAALMNFYAVDPSGQRNYYDLHTDGLVLAGAVAISIVAALLAGVAPAWESARGDIAIRLAGAGGRATARSRAHASLTVAQVALSFVLLVATGLMVRSASRLDTGQNFDLHNVVGVRLRPRLVSYPADQARAFTHEVLRRIAAMPEVESVSLTATTGPVWAAGNHLRFALPDTRAALDQQPLAAFKEVGPAYFATLRIPLLQGREFNDNDLPGSPRVVIINETLARLAGNGEPLMDRLLVLNGVPYRVVGIVKDALLASDADGPVPAVYLPYWQENMGPPIDSRLCVRVKPSAADVLPRLVSAIAAIDARVPVVEREPLLVQVQRSFTDLRVARAVLLVVGAVALFLTALGLYALVAFTVASRTKEIGIRLAMGAQVETVSRLFATRAARLVFMGCALGLVIALPGARLLSAWLLGVAPNDPPAFLAATAALALVGVVASYAPSRRAAKVDPLLALRQD